MIFTDINMNSFNDYKILRTSSSLSPGILKDKKIKNRSSWNMGALKNIMNNMYPARGMENQEVKADISVPIVIERFRRRVPVT